jgi:hypothetical protein
VPKAAVRCPNGPPSIFRAEQSVGNLEGEDYEWALLWKNAYWTDRRVIVPTRATR